MTQIQLICKKLLGLIGPLFPKNAKFNSNIERLREDSDFICYISWYLKNDINRPSKRSKTIEFIITNEFITSSDSFEITKEKLVKHIKQKLRYFDPHHNYLAWQIPPIEKWVVTI